MSCTTRAKKTSWRKGHRRPKRLNLKFLRGKEAREALAKQEADYKRAIEKARLGILDRPHQDMIDALSYGIQMSAMYPGTYSMQIPDLIGFKKVDDVGVYQEWIFEELPKPTRTRRAN